ncbi:MAG: acid--CoA ligase [Gammaproteobacteria bacterium]|nr:acid--CoA ligase [Gammaproteobacteria bacterium]|tara:strand:- start:973 stop:2517 length:1545 start_codon:yes stop_codon:yes gene_type:complete
MTVKHYDWSAYHSNVRPNKIAIRDLSSNRNLTYSELDTRSNKLAEWLQQEGVKKGDRIAILSYNCAEFFELEFACAKIGAIELPLNWRLTKPELEYILNDSSPTILIYDSAFREISLELQQDCKIKEILEIDPNNLDSQYESVISNSKGNFQYIETNHDDLIMIMYTSGTTGHPKGAMINHRMQLYNIVNLASPAYVNSDTVQLVVLPLFHTGGMNCYANPVLHAGGELILIREFDPGLALSILGNADYKVSHFFAVPAPYQFMMNHPDFDSTDLSNLKIAGIGGAPCAEAILKTWSGRGVSMIQGWGMTETSPGGIGLDAADADRKLGSAGKPLMHTEVKVVDDEGKELPWGEVGELYIKGPNVTPGYWNNNEATENSFDEGWLKTGDAARFDEEGFVYIVDRWKDMYISGGENVYPAEVENVIYQLPEIAEAAVIGVPHERWGETGKVFISLKEGKKVEEKEIIEHCLKNLAKFKVPSEVIFINNLPRNATGKVLKRDLREQEVGTDAPAIT